MVATAIPNGKANKLLKITMEEAQGAALALPNVALDAMTGKVLKDSIETPAGESKEAAKEKQYSRKNRQV